MEVTTFDFVILCLAVWRLSSLFANEAGPFDLFERIRSLCDLICADKYLGLSKINEGMKCEWCNSIWFSFLTCWVLFDFSIFNSFIVPLAVSTAVIFLKYSREAIERSNRIVKHKEPK
jgi:hypothetical protein